jgi:hypothetical protein
MLYLMDSRVSKLFRIFWKGDLFLSLYQHELTDTNFILWVIIQYCIIYFVILGFLSLSIGNSFSWLWDSFSYPHLFVCFAILGMQPGGFTLRKVVCNWNTLSGLQPHQWSLHVCVHVCTQFLLLPYYPGQSCLFPAFVLESNIL